MGGGGDGGVWFEFGFVESQRLRTGRSKLSYGGPEGLEVGVAERHFLDAILAGERGGLGKPLDGLLMVAKLARVTGEIVRDDADVGKSLEHCEELAAGLAGVAQFVEGIGLVDPTDRVVGCDRREDAGDFKGFGPATLFGVDAPVEMEDVGMLAGGEADAGEFSKGLGGVAEVQPALGETEIMGVRRFKIGHRGREYGNDGWFGEADRGGSRKELNPRFRPLV